MQASLQPNPSFFSRYDPTLVQKKFKHFKKIKFLKLKLIKEKLQEICGKNRRVKLSVCLSVRWQHSFFFTLALSRFCYIFQKSRSEKMPNVKFLRRCYKFCFTFLRIVSRFEKSLVGSIVSGFWPRQAVSVVKSRSRVFRVGKSVNGDILKKNNIFH